MEFDFGADLARPLLLSVVFTVVGVILFAACLWAIIKIAPFSIRKEIEEDQNIALGLIIGAMILGIAIILAATLVDFHPAPVPVLEPIEQTSVEPSSDVAAICGREQAAVARVNHG